MPLVWKVVSAMVAEAGSAPTEAGMLRGARQYLEHSYTNHVTATIHANRPQVLSSFDDTRLCTTINSPGRTVLGLMSEVPSRKPDRCTQLDQCHVCGAGASVPQCCWCIVMSDKDSSSLAKPCSDQAVPSASTGLQA